MSEFSKWTNPFWLVILCLTLLLAIRSYQSSKIRVEREKTKQIELQIKLNQVQNTNVVESVINKK